MSFPQLSPSSNTSAVVLPSTGSTTNVAAALPFGVYKDDDFKEGAAAQVAYTFKKLGEILTGATTFRFDGSDLMPGAIGAGSFWTGMVDYTNGKSAKDVADSIQASWDSIK